MTRVCGPILIKSGPAPAPRPRRGKTTAMTPVYEAVRTMKPKEHFEVPNSRGLDQTQASTLAKKIRGRLSARGYDEFVEVYETDGFGVVVRHKEAT